MQVVSSDVRGEGRLAYKWIVAIVVIFGIFMSVLDSTIVNIAIPRLQTAFGSSLDDVQWVLTGYTLAQGVATPLTAFIADRIGTKLFYMLSLIGFVIGSACCGLAWSLPVLILFRLVQGATGAFLTPLAMTLLYREFPPNERGTAMGALGIPILLAPALGPTLGGYIVTFAGWQLIFYINVPIGIAGLLLAFFLLRESPVQAGLSFDLPGFLLSALGLGLLLYGLSEASSSGWSSGVVLGCLFGGVVLLILFLWAELERVRHEQPPLLDVRVFRNRPFSSSMIASTLVIFALYGGLFLVPVYLQSLRDYSAFEAGLVLLPQAFASMVAVLVGGWIVDRLGVRAVVIPGLLITAFAMWRFTSLDLYTSIPAFQTLLILRGFGIGLCLQPLMVSAVSEIEPRQLAQASAVSTTVRFVGSSLAVAIIATLVQSQTKLHYAHMAERVTPDSGPGQFLSMLRTLLTAHGLSPDSALAYARSVVEGLLQRQAYMLAIQDAFWVTLGLALVAIVAACFVGSGQHKATPIESLPEEEAEEVALAREEAMLLL